MTKVVFLNDNLSPYDSWINPTDEEYNLHFSAVKSMEPVSIEGFREQNNKLIQLLESTHSIHEQKKTELLQLKEVVSDLKLDLVDERIESKQLRDELFSGSASSEELKEKEKEIKVRSGKATDKLEQINEQLIIRLQKSEKKHLATREKFTLSKQEMLRQIKILKLEIGCREKKAEMSVEYIPVSQSAWQEVNKQQLPVKSGIYQLTDGIQQCVGYFNADQQQFSKTTYFSIPTHWMNRPDLPNK